MKRKLKMMENEKLLEGNQEKENNIEKNEIEFEGTRNTDKKN